MEASTVAEQLQVALIGYKFMGKSHSNAYRQVAHFFPDLGAVPVMNTLCGRDRVGVEQAARQMGWQNVATDWKEVVRRPDIDLVDIVTPGDSHAEIAIAAAQAGKHVFCEKPMAVNVADCEAMIQAAGQAGVTLMVGQVLRFLQPFLKVRELVDSGAIGRPISAEVTRIGGGDSAWTVPWRARLEQSGGLLLEINAH